MGDSSITFADTFTDDPIRRVAEQVCLLLVRAYPHLTTEYSDVRTLTENAVAVAVALDHAVAQHLVDVRKLAKEDGE
jgi:hypothetical protein